jgi:hypothetical protein
VRRAALLSIAALALLPASARADDGPHPRITLPWAITQLAPSPTWLVGDGAHFGLRWQLTPLLWAYRMPPGARQLRGYVIDPLARTSGSVELNVSPWWTRLPDRDGGPFGVAIGVRSTLPLLEHGEVLAANAGVSWLFLDGTGTPVYEAGVTTFFGVVGLDVGYAPKVLGGAWLTSLRVRYF